MNDNYSKFLDGWVEYRIHVKELRAGQSIMKYLRANHFNIYDEMRGRDNDCYHNDDLILGALRFIRNKI